ncbi:MAG TPA: cysteine desulfurase family protein, partial [Candidatus Acidoferrum sp.]|nr:cysteine desulfurase family protein [Candidatus Acidoferrum sp.]
KFWSATTIFPLLAPQRLPFYPESSTLMQRIYLDHNATTSVDPAVLDAMLPFFSTEFGNASSIHTFGQHARAAVETAREQVAALIGARPQEIVFTSGGTESDNHAIFGAVLPSLTSPHVVSTTIEHEAVLNACQALEKQGVAVTYLPVDRQGLINLDDLRRTVRPETVLISVMHANNELGVIQPLAEIGKIAAEADVYLHTDAVQSAGKIPVDVKSLQLDLLSISGHKLYAPKGVGALFIKSGTQLRQFLYGGHHQRGFRPGTENVAGIVGLGKAAELARLSLEQDAARISRLRETLEQGILARIPDSRVNSANAPRTPNTSNILFSGLEGEALVIALDLKGVACSTGAACSSGAVEPSHVLTAIGLTAVEARASIRFSLGRHTTESEIAAAFELVPAAVFHLRKLSPTYQKSTVSS